MREKHAGRKSLARTHLRSRRGEDREALMKLTPHCFRVSSTIRLRALGQGCAVRETPEIWETGDEAVGT